MPDNRTARRLSMAAFAGVAAGAALMGLSPLAQANEDPGMDPPNCSTADLQGVQAGVEASTSAYLFTHPDLNNFMSGLQGLTRSQVAQQMQGYLANHPDENADMTGIRAPLQDLKNRCGALPNP